MVILIPMAIDIMVVVMGEGIRQMDTEAFGYKFNHGGGFGYFLNSTYYEFGSCNVIFATGRGYGNGYCYGEPDYSENSGNGGDAYGDSYEGNCHGDGSGYEDIVP